MQNIARTCLRNGYHKQCLTFSSSLNGMVSVNVKSFRYSIYMYMSHFYYHELNGLRKCDWDSNFKNKLQLKLHVSFFFVIVFAALHVSRYHGPTFHLSNTSFHKGDKWLQYEPRREKTGYLHMRKQRRRSAAKLISAFVFATRIVQSLYFLNPKFRASSHLLWLHSPVCVRPGRNPRRPVFWRRGSII